VSPLGGCLGRTCTRLRFLYRARIAAPSPMGMTARAPRRRPPPSPSLLPSPGARYEFTTPQGLHVAMSAAAQRGTVYVCGVSAPAGSWDSAKEEAARVVKSFRIKGAGPPPA
jgi:hypothetical protein